MRRGHGYYALVSIIGVAGLLAGCGGDHTNGGSVAGPTSVLQVNCPGSGPASAPFSSNGGTGTVSNPTGRGAGVNNPNTGADPEQKRLAESTTLNGAPKQTVVVNTPPTVGDTHIDVGVDCGGDSVGSGG